MTDLGHGQNNIFPKPVNCTDQLDVDNLNFNGNTISSAIGDIILSPFDLNGIKNKNMGDISGLTYKLGVVPLILDQQNTVFNQTYLTDDMWQSWKPSATALLGKVEIEINSAPSATLTIRIYEGEGTGGALLATKTITSITPNDWNAFLFDTPFSTTGGATYTMRATSTVGGFQWRISDANPYPDGRFSEDPGWDAAFKTYNAEPIRALTQILGSGYIGLMHETNPETLIEITDSTDVLWTLHNSTPTDSDGARLSGFIFKGHQSGDEETTLAKILISHDGTSDDEKGEIVFYTNDGNDGNSPTKRMRLNSAGNLLLGIGGIDYGKFIVNGVDSSNLGPHISLFTDHSSTDAVFHVRGWNSNDVQLSFGAYWSTFTSAWNSSDVGSNFQISKELDLFKVKYDSGISTGTGITWNDGVTLDTSGNFRANHAFGDDYTNIGFTFNTTSATFVDITGSSASVAFPTNTYSVLFNWTMTGYTNTGNTSFEFRPMIGATAGNTSNYNFSIINSHLTVSGTTIFTGPFSGNQTCKLQVKRAGGTGTLILDTTDCVQWSVLGFKQL